MDANVDFMPQVDATVEETDMRDTVTLQMMEMEARFFKVLGSFLQKVSIFVPVLANLTYDLLTKEFAHGIELITESQPIVVASRGRTDNELNGVEKELNQFALSGRVPDTIIGQCNSLRCKPVEERAKCISVSRSRVLSLSGAIVIDMVQSV